MKYVPTESAEEIHPMTNELYDATKLYTGLFTSLQWFECKVLKYFEKRNTMDMIDLKDWFL